MTSEFQARLQRLEALLREADRLAEPAARTHLQAVVQTLLELHSAGLERLLEHVVKLDAGAAILDACTRDDIVEGMLLLHGLHPLDLEARVRQALDQTQPFLDSHGGNVELIDIDSGIVRVRLESGRDKGPSSVAAMKQAIEHAICAKAPDVTAVKIEGATEYAPVLTNGRLCVALPLV